MSLIYVVYNPSMTKSTRTWAVALAAWALPPPARGRRLALAGPGGGGAVARAAAGQRTGHPRPGGLHDEDRQPLLADAARQQLDLPRDRRRGPPQPHRPH